MSQLASTIAMACASVVALVLLVPAVRRARAAGDLGTSAALTLGMGWLISLPLAVVAVLGELDRRPDAFGQLVAVFPSWYGSAADGAMLALAALAAALLFRALTSERVQVHTAGLFALLLWGVAQLASGFQGEPMFTLSGGALLVCLMAATVLPRGRGACLGAGIFGVTLAITSAALAVFRPDVAFVPCRDTCGLFQSSLIGALPNENLLGVALVVAIPFAYLGFRGPARNWLTLYLAAMAAASGSRTAIAAAGITFVALLVVRPELDGQRGKTAGRAAIAWLVLGAALFASVYVTQHDWDPTALTGRPALWQVASDHIEESPLLGYGPEKWASLGESGSEIPRAALDSTHNQWLDVLFRTGWIGMALLVAMLVATLWSAGYARLGAVLALATVAMVGTTERAWSIGAVDLFSFSFVALILTGVTKRELATSTAPRSLARRARRPPPRLHVARALRSDAMPRADRAGL